jgi:hypothetical protein
MHFQVQGIGGLACVELIIAPRTSENANISTNPKAVILRMSSHLLLQC